MRGLQITSSDVKDSPSGDGSLDIRRSSQRDRLIEYRESVLDLITATGTQVLNEFDHLDLEDADLGLGITAELKRFMDMARTRAVDEQGNFVDYDLLRSSQPYLDY